MYTLGYIIITVAVLGLFVYGAYELTREDKKTLH